MFRLFHPLNPPIRNWRGTRVWLVGASSGIGEALAQQLFALGARVALSARRLEQLQTLAAGAPDPAQCLVLPLDVTEPDSIAAAHQAALEQWGGIDLTILLAGTYQPMDSSTLTIEAARPILRTNLEGIFNVLAVLLPTLRRARAGNLAIVSSVAGYRGLPRSPVYGPTKAALNNLAESLYLELRPLGIGVALVNPGFVQTPLTALNDFPMPALISPEQAASETLRGLARGQFEIHYPKRFTLALKVLALLPPRLYFWLTSRFTQAQNSDSPPDSVSPPSSASQSRGRSVDDDTST